MKKILLILISLNLVNFTFGQSKVDLNVSLSNQGQIDKVLEDFYFPAHPTASQDDAHIGKDFRLKYNATLSYVHKDSFDIRLSIGYGQRINHYEQDQINTKWIYDDKQNIIELAPSFGFSKQFGRFRIGTGIQIPIYIIGNFIETGVYTEHSDSVNLSYSVSSKIKMDGGIIFGINNYVNLKVNLFKKLYLFTELNYGLLFANLGKKYAAENTTTFPYNDTYSSSFDKTYKKTYFSPISIQFGLGFRL
jgi:hypothetical protein